MAANELDPTERAILDFEGELYRHQGAKQSRIGQRFGMSLTEYLLRLNRLLDDPRAIAYAPQTVARLRRVRESQRG